MDNSVLFPKFPCRGCLEEDLLSNLHSLNDQQTRNLFTECTKVEIDPDDTTYQYICHSCYEIVENWSTFRRKALECDVKIRNERKTNDDQQSNDDLMESNDLECKVNVDELEISVTHQDHHDKVCSFCEMKLNTKRNVLVPQCKFCPNEYFHKNCLLLHKFSHVNEAHSDKKYKEKKHRASESNQDAELVFTIDESLICPYGLEEQYSNMPNGVLKGARSVKCDECSAAFYMEQELEVHKQFHSIEKSSKAPLPKKRRREKENPDQNQEKEQFFCEYCGLKFQYSHSLKFHIQAVHLKEKPHKCPLCEKSFTQNGNLTLHLRIHNNERNFKCEICDKYFITRGHVTKHIRAVHENYKPLQCDICQERFLRKYKLEKHLRVHRGERPFECEICGKTFFDNAALKKHKIIHMEVKPYKCKICGKECTSSSNLKSHERIHTK